MKVVSGNILDVKNSIIVHQVNCMGAMGAGLAKQIADKWPEAKESYLQRIKEIKYFCEEAYGFYEPEFCLGEHSLVEVADKNCVANLFSQLDYGRSGKRYTEYNSLCTSLEGLMTELEIIGGELIDKMVVFPYMMGCGLGGGDWDKVANIIDYYFPQSTIYKLTDAKLDV